jgi:hypothetical protein
MLAVNCRQREATGVSKNTTRRFYRLHVRFKNWTAVATPGHLESVPQQCRRGLLEIPCRDAPHREALAEANQAPRHVMPKARASLTVTIGGAGRGGALTLFPLQLLLFIARFQRWLVDLAQYCILFVIPVETRSKCNFLCQTIYWNGLAHCLSGQHLRLEKAIRVAAIGNRLRASDDLFGGRKE